MKRKKRVFTVAILLVAICLLLCACGEEVQATEKRLKEVRIFAEGAELGSFVYTYDDKGNPVRLETTGNLPGNRDANNYRLVDYEYDAEGRLTGFKGTDGHGDTVSLIFQYGKKDGITRAVVHYDVNGDGVLNEEEKLLPALFEFTFDADGYMLSYLLSFSNEWQLQRTYDEAHRVMEEYYTLELSSELYQDLRTFSYDETGNLIEKSSYRSDPYSDPYEFLGGMIADAGLKLDKSTATYFQQETYDNLRFNDEGLLISKDGEIWDSGGYVGDTSADYTYNDKGNLLLERGVGALMVGLVGEEEVYKDIETTIYHSGNDACIVMYSRQTDEAMYDEDEYNDGILLCEIFSDQFDFYFNSNSGGEFFLLPYGGSLRFSRPEDPPTYFYSDVYYLDVFPGLVDFWGGLPPTDLEFTDDGYLSRLDCGSGNYMELIYETGE